MGSKAGKNSNASKPNDRSVIRIPEDIFKGLDELLGGKPREVPDNAIFTEDVSKRYEMSHSTATRKMRNAVASGKYVEGFTIKDGKRVRYIVPV